MLDSTPICGYDTIRLTFPLEKRPSDFEWYGSSDPAPKRPPGVSDNPCLPQLALTGLGDSAYGGWYASLKGGRTLWRQQDGVHYEFHEGQWGAYAAVECSLPKLVCGHNKSPLLPSELPAAFDLLQWRIRDFLTYAPHVESMDVWRVDATLDTRLGGELELSQVAKLLADVPLNDVLPIRFPSGGSLRWVKGKGAGRPVYRTYSKSIQTGDETIAGQYRAEAQVSGSKALAYALSCGDLSPRSLPGLRTCDCPGRCEHKQNKYLRPQTLVEAENVCTGLLGPLMAALAACVGYVKGVGVMTSFEAVDLLVNKGGVSLSRAWQLVAYAHAIRNLGWSATGLKTKGRWQAEKEYKAAGVDPKLVDFSFAEKVGSAVVAGAAAGALFVTGAAIGDKLFDAVAGVEKPNAVVSLVEDKAA